MQARDEEQEQILTLATDALAAAHDHDRGALITVTRALLRALAMHLDDERCAHGLRDEAAHDRRRAAADALAEEYVDVLRSCSQTSSASECGCEPVAFSAWRRLAAHIEAQSPASVRGR
jgi:hypothetical protein